MVNWNLVSILARTKLGHMAADDTDQPVDLSAQSAKSAVKIQRLENVVW